MTTKPGKKSAVNGKRRLGRPPVSEKRDYRIPCRVSRDEVVELRKNAEACDMTLSQWVRAQLGLPATTYGSATRR